MPYVKGSVWNMPRPAADILIFNIYVLIAAEIGHEHLTPSEVR